MVLGRRCGTPDGFVPAAPAGRQECRPSLDDLASLLALVQIRDPAGDELADQGDLRLGREFQRALRIFSNQRLDAIPDHQGEIAVFGMDGFGKQRFRRVPPVFNRQFTQA